MLIAEAIGCEKNNTASQGPIINCGGRLQREFYSDKYKIDARMYEIDI